MTAKNWTYRAINDVQWVRLASISLVAILSLALLLSSLKTYFEWKAYVEYFRSWSHTDQADRCAKIDQHCRSTFNGKNPPPNGKETFEDSFKRFHEESTCRDAELAKQDALDCSVLEPGSFSVALKEEIFNSQLLQKSFFLWACFLALVFTARTVLRERHEGWRRLTLVLAPISAALIFIVVTRDQSRNVPHEIFVGYAALIFSTLALIAAKRVVSWVAAGFKPETAVGAPSGKIPVEESAISKPHVEDAASSHKSGGLVVAAKSDELETARAELIAMPLAGPWRRFWARTMDLWLFSFAAGFVAVQIIGPKVAEHEYLLGMALLPFVLLLETCVFVVLGNTPGKSLLGIRLTTVGGARPTFQHYYERSKGVYVYGLALGIPIVSIFTMIKQYQLLQSERPATYDSGAFSVRAAPLGPVRWTISFIGMVILLGLPGWLGAMFRH